MIRRELHIILCAVMFFTRLPFPTWEPPSQDYFSFTSRYFPFIGWLIGALGALVFWGGNLFWPLPVAVLLSMATTVLATGALHEDGFSDVCDGFGGGWTKEDILRIMKDSTTGVFGVVGLILLIGLKCFSLISLPISWLPLALICGHSLSRFVAISCMYTYDYVREEAQSKVKSVVRRLSLKDLAIAAFLGIFPCVIFLLIFSQGKNILLCLVLVWAVREGLTRYFKHWIGGYTGDCLGAIQQVTEVVFYLGLSV